MNWIRGLVLTAAMAGAAFSASAQVPTQQPEFFESDGVRVRYLVRGEGTPVVLLHGFATSIELNWSMGVLDALASSYRVIAIDLRGHGLSDKPRDPEAYGVRFVDDVTNLLDYLDIERAHLVGYSMGAAITAKLLVTHPERVLSAVLGGGGPQEPGERPAWRTAWLAGMERAAAEGSSVIDVLRMPDWPTLDPAIEAAVNRNDPAALAAILRGDESLSVGNAELRANTVPVLALIGTEDVTARPAVERMEEVMANLEVIRIPGANHITAVWHPLLVRDILGFLSRQSAAVR